jgi:hypothetical protein
MSDFESINILFGVDRSWQAAEQPLLEQPVQPVLPSFHHSTNSGPRPASLLQLRWEGRLQGPALCSLSMLPTVGTARV